LKRRKPERYSKPFIHPQIRAKSERNSSVHSDDDEIKDLITSGSKDVDLLSYFNFGMTED